MELLDVDLLDPAHDDLVRRWHEVLVADGRTRMGDLASTWELAELRALQADPAKRRRNVLALDGAAAVGALQVLLPLRDNRDVAQVWLVTHPEHTGRGVGTALLERAEQVAAEEGRTVLQASSEALVGADDDALRFAPAHGYEQAQVVLRSALPLPGDEAWRARMREVAAGRDLAATPDPDAVRVDCASDLPPDDWYDGLALLYRRMSTDVPLGDVVLEEEDWDAERVRTSMQRLRDTGRRHSTAAAFDRSGTMVGFTELSVSAGTPHVAYQGSTLVLREARGKRIGLRLKAANALHVVETLPQVTTVRTWNAEENGPMLDVNHAIGFATDAVEREWQKRVTA